MRWAVCTYKTFRMAIRWRAHVSLYTRTGRSVIDWTTFAKESARIRLTWVRMFIFWWKSNLFNTSFKRITGCARRATTQRTVINNLAVSTYTTNTSARVSTFQPMASSVRCTFTTNSTLWATVWRCTCIIWKTLA